MGKLAEIILDALPAYKAEYNITPQQAKACGSITKCRTGELGWVSASCGCGYAALIPASCRDRHCPSCQNEASLAWRESYAAKLPEVPTYHGVFTVPAPLHRFFRCKPRRMYNLLFACVHATLQAFCDRDPRLAGVKLGLLALLHTWGSQLQFHPHLHLLICGGGLTADGRWKALDPRKAYLFNIRALSRVFRGKLLQAIERELEADPGGYAAPAEQMRSLLRQAALKRWRVFIQRSRSSALGALNYLGRYSHRVAVAESRLLRTEPGIVEVLRRREKGPVGPPLARMSDTELVRRFLQHILPAGFRKVRAYGFLAKGWQAALRAAPSSRTPQPAPTPSHDRQCPQCGGELRYKVLDLRLPLCHAPP